MTFGQKEQKRLLVKLGGRLSGKSHSVVAHQVR